MTDSPTPPPSGSPSPLGTDATPYQGPAPDQDAKTLSLLAHLLNITLLGPLLIYLLKKDSHAFVADQSREALNFSLCCWILSTLIWLTVMFVPLSCFLGLVRLAIHLTQLVLGIIGAMKARDGIAYRYPLVLRFIQ